MAIDEKRINDFLSKDSFRETLAILLKKAGFQISWLKETGSFKKWGLYLQTSGRLREILSTKLELLIWVADFEQYQIRTISEAIDVVAKEVRLAKDLIIIVTGDPNTSKLVEETNFKMNVVGFSKEEIIQFESNNLFDNFLRTIQSRLYVKDLYWTLNPIQNPRYFYGHNNFLARIANLLANSTSNVGILGLRKMGKTSFLYRLLQILKENYRCYLCYLDIEIIGSAIETPSTEYFLWSLGEAIFLSLGRLRIEDFQIFGKYKSFFSVPIKESIPELFIRDFKLLLSQTDRNFVIAIDEVELMAPSSIVKGSNWNEETFIRSWRILRGLAQQNPGRISYFITGTNPKFIEVSKIGESDNPVYSYFSKEYLNPFSISDTQKLLQELGSIMGLDWDLEATELVHKRVGGHPLLVRAYGSVIHKSKLPRDSEVKVTSDDIFNQSSNFMLTVESQLSQMLDVIRDYYDNEYMLLEMLANGKIGEFRQYAEAFPNEVDHLKGYGMIELSDSQCEISVEPLQTWIRKKQRAGRLELKTRDQSLIGQSVGEYVVEALIGHSGGFSDVYRAKSERSNEYVAMKILKNGSLSKLQREVDALSKFNHPNIVKIISHGSTPEGLVYLVMEYLNGNTLRYHCERSLRLPPSMLKDVALKLLSALDYMHPDTEKLNKLRTKPELSIQDFEELSRALHGRIHRDIKPENIVLIENRGPILIDFNISVSASSGIRTYSHTPGYLPPDMNISNKWTPDVDLYQLGITLIQAATGIEYEYNSSNGESNIADISSQLKVEMPKKLCNVLLKLCSPQFDERFSCAKDVLRDLKGT